ncbi:hypothetical protein OG303_11620 [Streptomyces sp. NBC_00005]
MGRREKPLDPGDGAVQRFAYELRKLRDEAGTPTYREMALRAGYSPPTLASAAGGERLPSPPVLTAYVTACGGDPKDWAERLREAVAEAAEARVSDDTGEEQSPYPGLARFESGDGEHFHGRDDLTAELVRLTERARFAATVGASGSGKSSLLRAGLIPALRQAPDPARRPAAIRLLTPGPHPARTHEALFTPHAAPGDTLLVVDQFEEVFTLCADPAERARFLGQLLAATSPASRLRVLIAVRADFYGRCAEHGPLAEALRDATLLVGPMPARGLREAVVRPAAARRLVVERTLTSRIVADVADEPGGLPLMAHALREVWRRRTGKTLTLAAYEAVGGIQGAVAHTAEAAYAQCKPAEAAAVRALLLRLVNPGDGTEDTRRPADRAELDADDTTARILERLVRVRLLTVDGDTVDLAHEALIGAWPRLRGWIDEDRERLRLHRRLTEAAVAWAELGRDAGALYRGIRLTEAREAFGSEVRENSGELNRFERDFLAASVAAYEQGRRIAARATRRLRALTGALALLLCLAVVAGVAAWRQSGVSAHQRDEAEARRIAALVDTLRESEPRTAMRLALAAWHIADLPETRAALRTVAAQSDQDVFTQPEQGGRALDAPAWLSDDGRVLTTVAHDRAVQWDVRTHRRIRSVHHAGLSEGVIGVSGDGRFIAQHAPGGKDTVIRGLADGSTRRLATGQRADTGGRFGPGGHTFLASRLARDPGSDRMILELWDLDQQRVRYRYEHGEDDGPLPEPSPDERRLAWCGHGDTRLRVLDFAKGRLLATHPPRSTERLLCEGEELVFTPDGRAVAAATSAGIVTWDFVTGRERPRRLRPCVDPGFLLPVAHGPPGPRGRQRAYAAAHLPGGRPDDRRLPAGSGGGSAELPRGRADQHRAHTVAARADGPGLAREGGGPRRVRHARPTGEGPRTSGRQQGGHHRRRPHRPHRADLRGDARRRRDRQKAYGRSRGRGFPERGHLQPRRALPRRRGRLGPPHAVGCAHLAQDRGPPAERLHPGGLGPGVLRRRLPLRGKFRRRLGTGVGDGPDQAARGDDTGGRRPRPRRRIRLRRAGVAHRHASSPGPDKPVEAECGRGRGVRAGRGRCHRGRVAAIPAVRAVPRHLQPLTSRALQMMDSPLCRTRG